MRTPASLLTPLSALLLLAVGCKAKEPAPNLVTRAATPRLAPKVRLIEHGGRAFDLRNERGKVVALFFGYTHCPDICPTTLADFAGVRRRLGPRADRVKFVFISVDPKRDTPERAQSYARAFDRSFVGLSGDSATLAQIQRGFRTASYIERAATRAAPTDRAAQNDDYLVAHSASVYLIGPDGTVHETLRFGGGGVDQMLPVINQLLDAPVPTPIRVVDPWVRMQGDVTTPSAGYLTLENPGSVPVVVRRMSCVGVRMVTVHESKHEHGLVRMASLGDSIVVPAGGRVVLAPGGIHLMLMGLERPLNAGASTECTLDTSAGEVKVTAPVRAP